MRILIRQFARRLALRSRGSKLAGLACLLWLAAAATPARAQEFDELGRWVNGFTESWWIESEAYTRPEIDAGIARWMRIRDDLKEARDEDEWAGGYHSGEDTHGTYLRWSPRSGYVMFAVNKCEARVTNVDFGRVEFSPEVVRFISERRPGKAHEHGGAQGHSHSRLPDVSRLIPVKWRGNRYLLSPRDVAEFCEYAAGLGKYGDAEARLIGLSPVVDSFGKGYKEREQVSEELPVVPPEYARLVKRPIETAVTAVGPKVTKRRHHYDDKYYYESERVLRFGAGSLDGLKRGMTLRLIDSEHDGWIKLTRVGKRSSTGVLVRNLDDEMRETYKDWRTDRVGEFPQVRVGWRLTTSPRW